MSYIKITNMQTGEVLRDSRKEYIRDAIEQLNKEKEMSNIQTTEHKDFTPAEIDLIKSTIAKGATHDELKLFLYRCKNLGLDPLKPGQIYFIKYGSSPGTIVVGLEGFRSKAARTGKHSGTQRGVLRDSEGRCVGAWCEVSRSDWTRPAREEVSLHEYNTGKGNWAKMPETMIKKVAEAAALRMAFPDDLGGVYVDEEMDQAGKANDVVHVPVIGTIGNGKIDLKAAHEEPNTLPKIKPSDNPGEYIVRFGKIFRDLSINTIVSREWPDPEHKGQKVDGITRLSLFVKWCDDEASKKGLPLNFEAAELKANFNAYVDSQVEAQIDDGPKFDDDVKTDQIPW